MTIKTINIPSIYSQLSGHRMYEIRNIYIPGEPNENDFYIAIYTGEEEQDSWGADIVLKETDKDEYEYSYSKNISDFIIKLEMFCGTLFRYCVESGIIDIDHSKSDIIKSTNKKNGKYTLIYNLGNPYNIDLEDFYKLVEYDMTVFDNSRSPKKALHDLLNYVLDNKEFIPYWLL